MALEGDSFGQRRPPLYHLITNILREYPSGQVFKEIIQNADDAGATEVTFYLDCRNLSTLPQQLVRSDEARQELHRFQGPALMAYNNAPFQEEDWDGIQNLQQSGKAKNPHKVGKFGIGFNSVYHITDLAVIISEDRCGYLEPQEEIWRGESGKKYGLSALQFSCPAALQPYHAVRGFDPHQSFMGKTLFRFPLRNKPSKLSPKVCTANDIRQLLEVLKAEAKYLLLFLRSVCSIEVIEISDISQCTQFKVAISPANLANHQVQQKALVTKAKKIFPIDSGRFSKEVICEKTRFEIEIEVDGRESNHEWLVVHRIGCENDDVIALAKQKHVIPWVGTAYELSQSGLSDGGRIYCCLPLPTEDRAPFSINVNGTFAISSNRRSLNWESQERQGDDEGKWNRFLVERCIPHCYARLIQELIKVPSISPDVVYKCWPIISSVIRTPWAGLLKPLFQILLNSRNAIVHTGAAGHGEWISLNNAVLIPEKERLPEPLIKVVSSTGTKLVSLHSNQWRVLDKYYSGELTKLSPSLVRNILKTNRYYYISLPRDEKLVILKFCLSDKKYSDLAGLELIPLANDTFTKFVQCSRYYVNQTADIYVCSFSIPHDLLSGLEHIMIEHSHHSLLEQVAKSGSTQLAILTEEKVAELVPLSNPHSWSSAQLKRFWTWLGKRSLKHFNNLPIVPILNASGVQSMHNLSKQSRIVHVPKWYSRLDSSLRTGLEKCGAKFLCISEFPHLDHRGMGNFTHAFESCNDVLDALSDAVTIGRLKFTDNECRAIQNFFKSMHFLNAQQDHINKFCALAIFSVVQESACYSISQLELNSKAPVRSGTFRFSDKLLLPHPLIFETGQPLLIKVPEHVIAIDEIKYLEAVVFPAIKNGKFPQRHIDDLMFCILDNFRFYMNKYQYQKKSLVDVLSNLKFVTVEKGEREAPSSLFDPSTDIMRRLYQGKPVFPSGIYAQKYFYELQQCGLKGLNSITASMLYEVAQDISMFTGGYGSPVQRSAAFDRASALMEVLGGKCSNTLNQSVWINNRHQLTLCEAVCQLAESRALLPIASNKPYNYPDCLTWKGTSHNNSLTKFDASCVIVLPHTVDNRSSFIDPRIIGSEVLFVENIPLPICQKLMQRQSTQANLSSCVVRHFKHVINKKGNVEVLQRISFQTYEYLNSVNCKVSLSVNERWVWVESRSEFLNPGMCAISSSSSFSSSLEPFIYVLPRSMRKYENFLCNHGVHKSITSKHIISVLNSISKLSHGNDVVSAKDARTLIRNILEWVVENDIDSENILVPISSEENFPKLSPVNKVFYIDNEVLLEIAESSVDDCTLVDPSITHLAPKLGLTPLSDHLDITGEVFEDAGQHEPLTTRLSNILKEYKDGLTIIKEMIQNADDAEATEVNILYDSREHTKEKLLFKGMADSHGPALVIHNNAQFTKEDFTNITKLAGATKKDKPLKIGKFGVGFCSVYHITDVPSFVSGDWLYIFDPTLSYLKGIVKNENQPGKKVKYTSNLVTKTNQLAPYQDLFEFNRLRKYDGTMFRFPFRRHHSEISSTKYDAAMINRLKEDLRKKGNLFLLFLSNIKKIRFLSISPGQTKPTEEIVIQKSLTRLMQRNLLQIDITNCQAHNTATEHWLVSTEQEDKYHIYEQTIQPATASVACQLTKTSSSQYKVVPVNGLVFCYLPLSVPPTGLPVHISANFAVMSNRSGIWTSGSSDSPSDSREWWNQQLMVTIIQTAYCELLIMLKELFGSLVKYECHTLMPLGNSSQHPWQMMIEPLCQKLVNTPLFHSKFANKWLTLQQAKFLSRKILTAGHSTAMPQCVTACLSIMKLPVVDIPQEYLNKLKLLSQIPIAMLDQMQFCTTFMKRIEVFSNNWEVRNELLLNIFTTAASEIASKETSTLTELLENRACIPSTPDGARLKQAQQLVDPKSTLRKLFDKNSDIFPISMFCDRDSVHKLMIDIGLLKTHLPWNMMLECARSIPTVYQTDSNTALQRISILLKAIQSQIKKDKDYAKNLYFRQLKNTRFIPVAKPPEGYMLSWKGTGMDLSSPAKMFYPSPEINRGYFKQTPSIKRECWLLGSQRVLVDSLVIKEGGCDTVDSTVLHALEIDSYAHLDDVLANYQQLLESQYTPVTSDDLDNIKYACRMTYEFIERSLQAETAQQKQQQSYQSSVVYKHHYHHLAMVEPDQDSVHSTVTGSVIAKFQSMPFVWIENSFVSPENIASKWNENGPFLYRVPTMLNERKLLMIALCIKEKFMIEKLLNTLQEMHQQLGDNPLDEAHQKIADAIVSELNTYKSEDFSNETSALILPSDVNTLMLAENLSFNDSQWLPVDVNSTLVHKVLRREIALALGVKPIRSQFLEQFTAENSRFGGIKFGQREDLTQRIRNILRDYPLDATVLKELLQNADDAKATKMCIILDKRQHGTERLPSEEWSELQGPALVVWNNEEFKEKDIQGIQKLGLGSKRDDSESIGQFGIGFNVVYHLTDCPSFISGGKTLCVFDPHCRYALGATALDPGRRYDGLHNDEFWNVFSDIKAAYFRSPSITGQPTDLNQGSLFRFPLRSTKELVMRSEIVEDKVLAEELSGYTMEEKLDDWVPQIKEALVFLNHITEFSYYVINKDERFNLKCQYKLSMDSAAVKSRADMFECLKGFKENKEPRVFNYQISLDCTEVNKDDEKPTGYLSSWVPSFVKSEPSRPHKTYQEDWFIQQGVGDIEKSISEQKWRYIDQALPKHGIATPVNVSQRLEGKLFCFLPLQTCSGLPVHINGQFVLSSNRRSLWTGSAEGVDDKRDWNNLLFDAIASSYVYFMTEARSVVLKDEEYTNKDKFYACINKYYDLFPMWRNRDVHLEPQNCLGMAKLVFQRIWQSNAGVLAVEIHSKKETTTGDRAPVSTVKVQWNSLRNEQDPFNQVYFQPYVIEKDDKKKVISLLRRINMTLTCAPHIFYKNLITEDEAEPSIATPKSVCQFYCSFYRQIIRQAIPCPIQDTPFKTAETFYEFVLYILVNIPDSMEKQFPQSPFGYPLLLTADNVLRCFNPQNKAIQSTYSTSLFPNSLSSFLHQVFRWTDINSEYFLVTNEIEWSVIQNLLLVNLSDKLLLDKVNNGENVCIRLENLSRIWNCLTSDIDLLLKNHQKEILNMWALTPAKNGYLYSTKCSTLPIIPSAYWQLDSVDREAYDIFVHVGLAVIDDSGPLSNCGLLETCQAYFPTIEHYNRVLTILYHLHKEQNIFNAISPDYVKSILKYFQKTGFIYDDLLKNQIVSLPLFKSIEGHLTSLRYKKVYLWPYSGFCDAGYSKWAPPDSVVFLEHNGDWRALTNDFAKIAGEIWDEKKIYIDLVFPCFYKLSFDERKKHLEHIMENIYPNAKHNTEFVQYSNKRLNEQMEFSLLFINNLKSLRCIEHPETQQLCPISSFSDHTLEIFKAFSKSFIFLPEVYQEVKWYKFFCDLGLQRTVNVQLFINFCSAVQNGTHSDIGENIETASRVLLEYLFSSKAREWGDYYLQQIANICFVTVAEIPRHLSWIKVPCSPPLELISAGIKLTKLNQSVLLEAAPLIWTVKPVFQQPPLEILKENMWDREAFLEKLSVTSSPSSNDIVANLVNISKSRFSNFDLFTTYKQDCLQESADQPTLLSVVSTCLDRLNSQNCSPELLSPLKNCACVPVFARPSDVVLVRPIQVVRTFVDQNDARLKPHINELPRELMSYYSIFETIGIHTTIDFIHVRHVLETLYLKFGRGNRTNDPNVIQILHHCIVKLNDLLSKEDRRVKQDTADQLSPLYLPYSVGRYSWSLKSSEKLVFVDSSRYRKRQPEKFNFAETDYSLFEIPKDRSPHPISASIERVQMNYASSPTEKRFCLWLPTKVRPLQLSLCSLERRLNVGSTVSDVNNIAVSFLRQSRGFLKNFEMILKQMLVWYMQYKTDPEMEPFVTNFFSIMRKIEFTPIEGLQASLIFKDRLIGTLSSPTYVLEREHDTYTLYIDESVSCEPDFFYELSRTLLMEVARLTDTNLACYFSMIEPISKFFQIRSSAAMLELGTTYNVNVSLSATEGSLNTEIEDSTSLIPVVGKKVPEYYVSQLDSNINNIFYPQEWVAYEVSEESFIWAMVLYPVSDQSSESKSQRLDRYVIISGMKDNENLEIEVSAVDLYKIFPEVISETEPSADEQALILAVAANNNGGDIDKARQVRESHTVIAIKRSIYADLKRISQLTDEKEKRKAIKRLYLLYHPDKVKSSNKDAYEEGFKYLKRQVDRLEEGKPLEEPDSDDDTARHTAYEPSQTSSSYFNQWDSYIPRRSRYASSQRHGGGPTYGGGFSFHYQPQPDNNEAKRWLKQARTDHSAMVVLLEKVNQCHYERGDTNSVVCQTIFLAREVVEKALKAGMYKLVGLNEAVYLKSHELYCHAVSISSQRSSARQLTDCSGSAVSLEAIASWIDPFYSNSRFPNKHSLYKAPVDVYSIEEAEKAADYAQVTLTFISSLM